MQQRVTLGVNDFPSNQLYCRYLKNKLIQKCMFVIFQFYKENVNKRCEGYLTFLFYIFIFIIFPACGDHHFKERPGNHLCTKCGENSRSTWNYTRCECQPGFYRNGNVHEMGDRNTQRCIPQLSGTKVSL